MSALEGVLLVAVVLLGLLVVGLLRSHAEILRQLHQLGAGREDLGGRPATHDHGHVHGGAGVEAPVELRAHPLPPRPAADAARAHDVVGVSPDGEAVAVAVAGAAAPTLLAFLSTGCATCQDVWAALAEPDRRHLPPGVRLLVVTKGEREESPAAVARLAPPGLTTVMSTEAWLDYGVPGSPYYVHVAGGAVRGEGTAGTWEQVARLWARAEGDLGPRPRPLVPPDPRLAADLAGAARVDAELAAAGFEPGDPRLHLPPEGTSR